AAGALPGQGGDAAAAVRLSRPAARRRERLAGRALRAVRLGPDHLGYGPLRARRRLLPDPGHRHRPCRTGPADDAVSAPPRGGGPRSLGASLLDAGLPETLDPAYAQAAEAKAARGEPARPRWRGRALVALTMAIAGVLVAVTYDQASATSQGRQEVRAALVRDIQRESAVSDDLTAQRPGRGAGG